MPVQSGTPAFVTDFLAGQVCLHIGGFVERGGYCGRRRQTRRLRVFRRRGGESRPVRDDDVEGDKPRVVSPVSSLRLLKILRK